MKKNRSVESAAMSQRMRKEGEQGIMKDLMDNGFDIAEYLRAPESPITMDLSAMSPNERNYL